jgi:hypothetical protein
MADKVESFTVEQRGKEPHREWVAQMHLAELLRRHLPDNVFQIVLKTAPPNVKSGYLQRKLAVRARAGLCLHDAARGYQKRCFTFFYFFGWKLRG